jgi:isopenicillin N synthase-like dioxygenase
MSKQLIPELSYIDIKDGNKEALAELKNALTEYGFFSITDHGLNPDLLASSYTFSKKFFDLPVEEKSKYAFPQNAGAPAF